MLAAIATVPDEVQLRRERIVESVSEIYKDNLRTIKAEVLRLIRSGSALRPSLVDIDSRSPVTLMTLVGSVPAHVDGEEYEIPITIWLTDSFPTRAPPVYVTPNPGTMLDPLQRLVDEKGSVRIPYLESWGPQSTLSELERVLEDEFSKCPPVYAKPDLPKAKAKTNSVDIETVTMAVEALGRRSRN